VGNIEGKRLFGRPRHRWEDSFKFDLILIGSEKCGFVLLPRDTKQWQFIMDNVMKFRVPCIWRVNVLNGCVSAGF